MSDVRIQWLRTAATSLRTALTAAALTLLLGFGAASVLSAPQPPAAQVDLSAEDEPTSRLMERHQCSTTGFEPGVIPATAIIRDQAGRTRLVSFEQGWAVFNDERPGELVAVCLGRPRAGGR
ncbi:hypothetical protein [Nocardioides bizhenqiangii]|uniref:Uncharacterized protein n=1 Tax=Nocardioides bizhenqiangii TaxID=3095076 RepID=A0ABZ0ZPH5_9ACTN|nr:MULTISPECIES: hypothetical protein [unclassified Nocardioides]MDZ5619753.1 hypothetical protein [Nocardioides sp. HM23]WQQ26240.1 hypothetical protein SHK19_20040 [Nocardioides sp. HM61]